MDLAEGLLLGRHLQCMWLILGCVFPPSTNEWVNYRWEGGPILLFHLFGGLKTPWNWISHMVLLVSPANTSG